MSNKRQIYDPNIDRDHSRPPAAIASVLDHMREGVASQRFRLALVGAQPSKAATATADRHAVTDAGIEQPPRDVTAPTGSEASRRHTARDSLNARMRPILYALAQNAGLDPAVWKARIDAPMPLTDPEIVRALPEVFASDAFRDARAACRDMTLLPPERRRFAEAPFDLGFRGCPPPQILVDYPCWDLPFVPGARALERWTISDASDWMLEWPPESGELKHPIDLWDAPTADLWLRRHTLFDGHEADKTDTLVAFREGRSRKNPLKVLAGLDDDALLVLTDAVLCERLRREVMSGLMQDRADLIHVGLDMVACGYLSLDDVRAAVAAHDEAREERFREAFADNDDWMGEWIVDWSRRLIGLYDWPLRYESRAVSKGE